MKKIFIGLGALVLIIAGLYATDLLTISLKPIQEDTASLDSPDGWRRYENKELKYSISYPADWQVKESEASGANDVFITNPAGNAFVRVYAFFDSALISRETIESSIAEYKASFDSRPGERLDDFKSEIQGDSGIFAGSGFMTLNNLTYQFLERGTASVNGRVLITRGAADIAAPALDDLAKTIRQMMDSLVLK